MKIRPLPRKFNQSEHKMYADHILPRNPGEIAFEENVLILKKYLGRKFSIQHQMAGLKPDKKTREDYFTLTGIVNREGEMFKLK